MNTKIKGNSLKSLLLICFLVLLDQLSKIWAVNSLMGEKPIILIKNVFQLQYLENRGAAFGILKDQRWIFYLCVFAVTIVFIHIYRKMPDDRKFVPLRWCGIFILAGAYGNLIDRVANNYVVDFFYFKLIDFPIFNVADIYVTCAAIILMVLCLFYYKEEDFDRITG